MSDGEVAALLISLVISVVLWLWMGYRFLSISEPIAVAGAKRTWLISLVASAAINIVILRTLAASDVRNAIEYLCLYFFMGLAASGLSIRALGLIGFQEMDITQRSNPAARVLLVGMSIASSLAFGGANIGDGPGFYVVIPCAVLSLGTLLLAMILRAIFFRAAHELLVDRDVGRGWRFACLLIASGAIAGRAVAGNWISLPDTIADFANHAWPVLILLAADLAADLLIKSDSTLKTARDVSMGVLLVVGAAAYVWMLGWPS